MAYRQNLRGHADATYVNLGTTFGSPVMELLQEQPVKDGAVSPCPLWLPPVTDDQDAMPNNKDSRDHNHGYELCKEQRLGVKGCFGEDIGQEKA